MNKPPQKLTYAQMAAAGIKAERVAMLEAQAAKHRAEREAKKAEEATKRTVDELPVILDGFMERTAKVAKARSERFNAWFTKQIQTVRCARHDVARPLDYQESFRQSISMASGAEKMTLVYAWCPKCWQDAHQDWLTSAGVPSDMIGCTLENWRARSNEDRQIIVDVRKFVKHGRGLLYLWSKLERIGNGKTHLAIGVMKEMGCGIFRTENDLIEQMRDGYGDKFAPDIEGKAKRAKLFVLDEIGLSVGGRDVLPLITRVLEYRRQNKLPTVGTGNHNPQELGRLMGERMADRTREWLFRALEFRGQSFRAARNAEY